MLLTLAVFAPSVSAGVPNSGFGFSIADDDGNWNNPTDLPQLGHRFLGLKPKVFRLQIVWNAFENGKWEQTRWIARTHAMIDRARAQGVEQIILTIRGNQTDDVGQFGYFPTVTEYDALVRQIVQNFASKVDVWGAANEPNLWKPSAAGGGAVSAALLAQWQARMRWILDNWDPNALLTSPDFNDETANWAAYVDNYKAQGGTFGNAAAFHPYKAVQDMNDSTVTTFASKLPAGLPIWVTEVGARWSTGPAGHEQRVNWIINTLGNHPRVNRISYYHMRSGNPSWDSALMNSDYTRRPAWFKWCAASHGSATHTDCAAPPAPLTSSFNGGFASYRGVDGLVDVFARGSDGTLQHRYYQPGRGWTAWGSLGGQLTSEPSAITYGGGEIDVFARGASNQVVLRQFRPATGWGPWVDMGDGGHLSGPAALHRGGGVVDLFARGGDGTLIHRQYNPGGGWTAWESLGGQLTSEPSAITYGGGEIDVFARGGTNQLIIRQYRPGTGWYPWQDLGGSITSAPSAMHRGGGVVDVFARGGDKRCITRTTSREAAGPAGDRLEVNSRARYRRCPTETDT